MTLRSIPPWALAACLSLTSMPALGGDAPSLAAQSAAPLDADYILSGEFAAQGKFRAPDFIRVVTAMTGLLAKDPELHGRLNAALRKHGGGEAADVAAYLSSYRANPCRTRHVETNLDVSDYREFAKRLLASREFGLACASMKNGDFKTAARLLDAALAKDPRLAAAYLNRAVAKAALEDSVGASQDYTESQKTPLGSEQTPRDCLCDPSLDGEAARLKASQASSAASKKLAMDAYLGKDYASAVTALDEASGVDPGDPETLMTRAAAYEKLGDTASALSDYQGCSVLGVSAARWSLAADCVLNVARLEKGREGLSFAAKSLDRLLKDSPPEWPRREALFVELAALNARAAKAPGKKPR